jgi:hypothetical protein
MVPACWQMLAGRRKTLGVAQVLRIRRRGKHWEGKERLLPMIKANSGEGSNNSKARAMVDFTGHEKIIAFCG